MNKYSLLLPAAALSVCSLAACGSAKPDASSNPDRIQIVTTIFPEYDWVQNILKDNPAGAEVTLLLDSGVDLHSYQPTADDILKISQSDVFIYVGGESDEWVEDALSGASDKDRVVLNLLELLGDKAKEEVLTEGMEEETEEGEEEEGPEYDEHVWLSLRNTSFLIDPIASAIAGKDPANADLYKANAQAYQNRLNDLDRKYSEIISSAGRKTLLFGDRFPFRYLTDDYGLDYYAAFPGCSAETEASFETIIFLAGKADELSLNTILTIEGSDHKIAETIRDNTAAKNQKILTMDSMQARGSKDAADGITCLSIMEKNLEVLKEALN